MKRIHANKTIGFGLIAGLLTGATLLTAAPDAQAQTATYAATRRQINACVLATSNTSALFPPYAFYELDARNDLKPGNWDIINPLASSTLGGAGYRRWQKSNDRSTDGSFLPGAPLTKNMAPYWEVNLNNISDEDLRKMDIVLLPLVENVNLTNEERERLRRFVDNGGTLWIDLEVTKSGLNNFFIDIVNGKGGSANLLGGGYHPLLRFPNILSDYDRYSIVSNVNGSVDFNNAPYMVGLFGGASATLGAGDYGAGHVIFCAVPVASNINTEISNFGKNLRTKPAFDSDLKLLTNMIAWTTSAPTQGGNARRTGSTGERIGSQLGEKWSWAPKAGSGGSGGGSGAVIFKGLVFYVDSANVLHAFDRDPAQNLLKGPNGADDGLVDFSAGTPYDEVFNVPTGLEGRVSTPTVGSTSAGDFVAVTDQAGNTAMFALAGDGFKAAGGFSGTGGNRLTGVVPSPIFSEGLFFAVTSAPPLGNSDGTWRIVALNPATGKNVFAGVSGANSPDVNAVAPYADNSNFLAVTGMSNLTGPIAMGYIKDTVTGALDKVIYCPTIPPTLAGTTVPVSVVAGIWFSTKSEPLESFPISLNGTVNIANQAFRPQQQSGRNVVPWYLNADKPEDPLNPVLRVTTRNIAANGTVTESTATLTYGKDFTVVEGGIPLAKDPNSKAPAAVTTRETEILLTTPLADNQEVYADYTLNWPAVAMRDYNKNNVPLTGGIRGDMGHIARVFSPLAPNLTGLPTPPVAQIIGGMTLSSEDVSIFNTTLSAGPNGPTGRIYAVREQYGSPSSASSANSRGIGTQIPWTYSPEPSLGTTTKVESSLINYDPPKSSFLAQGYLKGFTPVGSPAIANGTVYVVGTTQSPAATVIMALRANPSMTIAFGANTAIPTPLPGGWSIRVFNRVQEANETNWYDQAPHLENGKQFSIDPDGGNLSIFDCTFSNNAGVFNLGEPVVIGALPPRVVDAKGVSTQPPPVVIVLPLPGDPTATSPLDNLIWYMALPQVSPNSSGFVLPGAPTSGPALIGDTLYFSAANGIGSVDIRGSGRQHYLHITNPTLENKGVDNSDSNLRVHLLGRGSLAFGKSGSLEPPTGTERTLVMGLSNGVTAFDARPTLIADGSRLLEVDYGGNAVWSMESTQAYVTDSNGNSVATATNLARPGVAHRLGLDEFLFADTNNNRVTLADRGGVAQWELTKFNNDMGFVPPGFPLALNSPTDIQFEQDAPAGKVTFAAPGGKTFTYTGSAIVNRYLIADSGNFRLLEIVDVLDANTGVPVTMSGSDGAKITMSRQCSFVSRALGEQNQKKRYRSIQEFAVPLGGGGQDVYIVAAIANTASSVTPNGTGLTAAGSITASGSNQEGLGGSIEVLHRDFTDATKDGATVAVFSSLILPAQNAGGAATYIPLNNVTYCKGFYDPGFDKNALSPLHQFAYQYMIADSNGCYVVNSAGTILWMLTSDDYYKMTGRPLRASSIQRLTQADFNTDNPSDSRPWYARYLITNRYEGPDAVPELFNGQTGIVRGQIHGEVFEIRSLDYATKGVYPGGNIYQPQKNNGGAALQVTLGGNLPIMWLFPNEKQISYQQSTNIPGQTSAVYSIDRSVGNKDASTFTSPLQQPTFAERPN